jgi:uncharacterized caspase-like protein
MRRRWQWWLALLLVVGVFSPASAERRSEPAPRLFVLSIGINAYPPKERLHFAVKDARSVGDVFRHKGSKLFRLTAVKLLLDRAADRQGILDGLAWLRREATSTDRAVIFYSGHGGRNPDVGFHLVPADFRNQQPRKTMVSGTELKEAAAAVRAPTLVLLDCCYSGGVLKETSTTPVLALSQSSGPSFLCASRPREESEEKRAVQHGTFTRALLEALSGKADFDGDGVVRLNEVERYLKQRVPKLSPEQHPVSTFGDLLPSTPLTRP